MGLKQSIAHLLQDVAITPDFCWLFVIFMAICMFSNLPLLSEHVNNVYKVVKNYAKRSFTQTVWLWIKPLVCGKYEAAFTTPMPWRRLRLGYQTILIFLYQEGGKGDNLPTHLNMQWAKMCKYLSVHTHKFLLRDYIYIAHQSHWQRVSTHHSLARYCMRHLTNIGSEYRDSLCAKTKLKDTSTLQGRRGK